MQRCPALGEIDQDRRRYMHDLRLPGSPDHYGKATVERIRNAEHVMMLLDELGDEMKTNCDLAPPGDKLPNGFYHNRSSVLQAFGDGTLFGMLVAETEAMQASRHDPETLFMRLRNAWPFSDDSYWPGAHYLPCFCVVNAERECAFIWTAARARNMKLGSALVRGCNVQTAMCVLQESVGFWTELGFELDENSHGHTYVLRDGTGAGARSVLGKRALPIQ